MAESKIITGICRQGQGRKLHWAHRHQIATTPGTAEALKYGAFKTTGMYAYCDGENSRGGKGYWSFSPTEDFSRVTCKDCIEYKKLANARVAARKVKDQS